MCRAILLGIIALLASSSVQAQGQSSAERELIKLENDWGTAMQKRDTAFLQKLFADEFLSTDAGGAAFDRAQEFANWTSEGTRVESFLLSDLKVHVYGDTAVVTGVNTMPIRRGMGPGRCRSIPPRGPHRRDDVYLPFFSVLCPAFWPGLSLERYDSPSMTRS